MNNKGFTLIELIASIILLSIVMSITTVSVVGYINSSREKSYDLLISNIKVAAQEYFEECENYEIMNDEDGEDDNATFTCSITTDNTINITIGKLLQYGFLSSSATDSDGNKIVENPKTNESINNCGLIVVKKVDSNYLTTYEIISNPADSFCPQTTDF